MAESDKPCPILILSEAEVQQFHRIPPSEVEKFLAGSDYGPTKRLASSFYLSPDKKTGVSVLEVTEEICRDHFGIQREGFVGHGWVLRSKRVLTEAQIVGAIADRNSLVGLKRRAEALQAREIPIFPL